MRPRNCMGGESRNAFRWSEDIDRMKTLRKAMVSKKSSGTE